MNLDFKLLNFKVIQDQLNSFRRIIRFIKITKSFHPISHTAVDNVGVVEIPELCKCLMDNSLHMQLVLRSIILVEVGVGTYVDFVLIVVAFYHRKDPFDRVQFALSSFTLDSDPAIIIQEGLRLFGDMDIQAVVPERYRLIIHMVSNFLQESYVVWLFEVTFLNFITEDAILTHTSDGTAILFYPVAIIAQHWLIR